MMYPPKMLSVVMQPINDLRHDARRVVFLRQINHHGRKQVALGLYRLAMRLELNVLKYHVPPVQHG